MVKILEKNLNFEDKNQCKYKKIWLFLLEFLIIASINSRATDGINYTIANISGKGDAYFDLDFLTKVHVKTMVEVNSPEPFIPKTWKFTVPLPPYNLLNLTLFNTLNLKIENYSIETEKGNCTLFFPYSCDKAIVVVNFKESKIPIKNLTTFCEFDASKGISPIFKNEIVINFIDSRPEYVWRNFTFILPSDAYLWDNKIKPDYEFEKNKKLYIVWEIPKHPNIAQISFSYGTTTEYLYYDSKINEDVGLFLTFIILIIGGIFTPQIFTRPGIRSRIKYSKICLLLIFILFFFWCLEYSGKTHFGFFQNIWNLPQPFESIVCLKILFSFIVSVFALIMLIIIFYEKSSN